MLDYFKNAFTAFTRRKVIESDFESPLHRCLVFWDLLLLGVGGSVDVALYVLLGNVMRDFCGPSVIISITVGFFLCLTCGLCYAEFASYVPTSGSDYDYTYLSLGELCGFLDGWSILVGCCIATSTLAQGAADLLRSLTNSVTFDYLDAHLPLPDHALLATNVNIVAAIILIVVSIITAMGVQHSVRFNDAVVAINLLVILFTFITGLVYVDNDNWSSWDKFAPYGVTGILRSLPYTIFFFGGFLCITYSSEEVINPQKILPWAITSSIFGIFICFFCIGTVLSLIIPYNQLSTVSPLSDAFGMVAFKQSKYIIAFGGCCSCFSSVLTACYANSRMTYVMARDGLIMKSLKKVNKRTLVPVRAVLITGFIAIVVAAFVDLTILIEICSILTIFPWLLLGTSVVLLRYKEYDYDDMQPMDSNKTQPGSHDIDSATEMQNLMNGHLPLSQINSLFKRKAKTRIVIALVVLFLASAGVSLVINFGMSHNLGIPLFVTLCIVFTIPLLVSVLVIYKTPHQPIKFPFTMPLFPILPTVFLILCVFVMFQFSMWSWILFIINTIIGKYLK
jgi:amino acid transporter